MAKIDEAKRAYWGAKVKEAQKKARLAVGDPTHYVGVTTRAAWRARYRAELRRIMAAAKL